MIFDNQYKGIFRVEAAILNYKPASDDVIYNDQDRNASTIYSLPYDQYKFFLGSSEGLPDWVIRRVNRMFSFNILTLDGVYYNKLDGAKFEEKRESNFYPFSGQAIDIMPVENGFQEKINTDSLIPIDENMIQYQKVIKYLANSADITVTGKLKNLCLLARISIINRSGIDLPINVSTTSTGSEDDINIDLTVFGITQTFVFNQLFHEDKGLNITGLNTYDCDVIIEYIDYTATASGTPNAYSALGKGATVIYTELLPGYYDIDFDFATGLGRIDTEWEGWAIADGRNGTKDFGALIPIGYKDGDADFGTLDNELGSIEKTLTIGNLPSHDHVTHGKGAISGNYFLSNDNAAYSDGGGADLFGRKFGRPDTDIRTGDTGSGDPVDVLNPVKVSLWVVKIVS